MIKIKNLNKFFKNNQVLKNINLTINRGEKIAIIGPSGSGKSTLLRCLNLLEIPSSGEIWLDDIEITSKQADIKKIRQKMTMVFQHFNLFANRTVLENIILAPVKLQKIKKQNAINEAMNLLQTVNLENKANCFASQLSGGQQQRVAIVRAIAVNPEVVLLDEPTSALDPEMVSEVLKTLKKLANSSLTIICVTHEIKFATEIANKMVFVSDGEIVEQNTPLELIQNPKNQRLCQFLSTFLK